MKRTLVLLMLLIGCMQQAWAQARTVKGKVLDETNQGLPGAGVVVKGTSNGTSTDVDGNFQLELPDGKNVLSVQAIGYNQQDVTVAGNTVTVKLQVQARELHETVVTALGIRRERRSLGYTQSTVDSATIERSGEQNIVEALAAKTPGLLVTGSGGTPGASSQILLRGNNNISGTANQPIFVVDGIIIDNSTSQPAAGDYPYDKNLGGVNESNRGIDINPNDIESISVLRGPAAAALYGSQGGNGAIIITTKRGKFGKGKKKLGVEFTSSFELSYVNKLPKLQRTFVQGTNGYDSAINPTTHAVLPVTYSHTTNQSWGPRADTAGIPIYDKYRAFFRTGEAYTNNVAVSWGGENSDFRLSLGDTKNDGVIPNSEFKRTTANLRADAKLSNFLSVGGTFNYTTSQGTRVQNGSNTGGIMLTLLRAPINYDINNSVNPNTGEEIHYYSAYDNPLFSAYHNPYTDITNRVFGNVNATATFAPGLTLTERLGVDAYNTDTKQIFDIYSVADDNADGAGQVNLTSGRSFEVYNDLILHYDKRISSDFEINSLLGYNYQYNAGSYLFSRGRNIQIPGIYELGNTSDLYASNSEAYGRTSGLFGEVTLGYRSRLYVTATGRNDWTSSYGRNGQSLFYPKVDAAWIFTEGLPKNNILNYGKVRLAYADAGTGPLGYLSRIYTQPFITDGNTNGVGFPYLGQVGFAPSNVLIDLNAKPQHVQGKEAGLELHMFHNRVTFEGTVYYQLTLDNLISLPIAPSTGYVSYATNGGTSRNEGVELALNIDVLKGRKIGWSVFGNFTMDRSKVLAINPNVSEIATGNGFSEIGSYAIVGQPVGVFYGTAWMRDSATGKILVDANGKALVDPVARKVGNPNPDWTMGLGSTFTYKNFIFSFLWDIRHGGDIWNGTWARDNRLGISEESGDRNHLYLIDGVYEPGIANAGQKNTTQVNPYYYYQTFKGDNGNYAVENAIQDGGWVRLRSVNLSYRFTFGNSTRQTFFEYMEVGVTGKNLLLFTKYKGVDPETSLTGASTGLRGYDYFNNPGTKSVLFSVKLGL